MNAGVCPYCRAIISSVKLEHVDVKVVEGRTFHGVSYVCSACRFVLSVSIDPVALKGETVSEIVKKLQG